MSLFDDDFYSSKVSRKTLRDKLRKGKGLRLTIPRMKGWNSSKLTTLQIAFISSFASAIAACVIFGLIFGFGGSRMPYSDPSDRAVHATDKVRPAVVSIINEQKYSLELKGTPLEEGSEESGIYRQSGVGSGVIVKKEDGRAYIITNYHVVANAHRVKAVLTDGEMRDATVVGLDQITDLAVLEIDGKGISAVAEIGDSSKLRAAEFVVAIGNPLGMGESITLGVVSVTREIVSVSLSQNGVMDWEQEVIRVDAAINQGNSGGPLIDLSGQVVGINSMKISNFGVESIGYAIPINNVMPVVDQLIEKGYVSRPFLGVSMLDLEQYWQQEQLSDMLEGKLEEDETEPDTDLEQQGLGLNLPRDVFEGIIVLEVFGPAKEAGIEFNDVIVKLDELKVGSIRQLRKYLYEQKKIGDVLEVEYYRGKELKSVKITLGENIPE